MVSSAPTDCVQEVKGVGQPRISDRVAVVVERGQRFEGFLTFRGSARIDGELRGQVVSRGTLLLGEAADVRANIEVDEVVIGGCLEGDVTARCRIQLLATARVRGRLQAPLLALADGCLVRGRCLAGSHPEPELTLPDAPVKSPAVSP